MIDSYRIIHALVVITHSQPRCNIRGITESHEKQQMQLMRGKREKEKKEEKERKRSDLLGFTLDPLQHRVEG